MYELVKTRHQQKKFEKTWEYFCTKYGWYNDPYAKDGSRYNLLLHKKSFYRRNKVIGTIEFIPYHPDNPDSTVEGPTRFKFSTFAEIKQHQHRIWEIDKVCIHKDYQRKGYFKTFLHILMEHAEENKPKYYLGLVEKKFYRMLRITFGSAVEQKGEALVGPDSHNALIPTVLHIGEKPDDEEGMKQLLKRIR